MKARLSICVYNSTPLLIISHLQFYIWAVVHSKPGVPIDIAVLGTNFVDLELIIIKYNNHQITARGISIPW